MVKKKTVPVYPAFPGHGALTRDDKPQEAEAVLRADSTKDGLVIHFPKVSPVSYPSTDLTVDQKTGRLTFTSAATRYQLRELREDDGEWLSKYKTLLPLPALGALVEPGTSGDQVASPDDSMNNPSESIDAFATEDSVYIVGVVYTNTAGRWSRQGGDWILLAGSDTTFSDDDMMVIPIDPAKAGQFLDMYDQNHVTVTDAERYEAQDAYVPSDEDESDSSVSDQ
jgi:hypothetical protein